jgi:ABC-type branched-subunit amino acid transport system permease subunit
MIWLGVVLAGLFVAYPWLIADDFYGRMGADVLLAAIGASAWNILGGYAGQISVGHAVFFGIGAYLPLLAFTHLGLPPVAGVPLAIVISLAVAVVIGLPTFRLHGHYFSMATIAVAELIRIAISNWDFVGAATGLMGPAVSRTWLDLSFRSPIPYYYLFLAVLACLLLLPGISSAAAWAITGAPSAPASVPRAASACRSPATSSSHCCSPPPSPRSPARSICSWSASSIRKADSASSARSR